MDQQNPNIMTDWSSHYASRVARLQASEIRELLKLVSRPDIISFGGGIPDPKFFPVADVAAACQRILTDPARATTALQYALSEGYLPLRQWLAQYMKKFGVDCTPDNILITWGSQQALDFVGKLFISPGDTVLVEWPTYLGALQAFNAYEPHYEPLPGPGSNRTPASYCTDGKAKPKFGYVTPEFQNPTGYTLSLEDREALIDAMLEMDIPLVEDSPYEQLRYDGKTVPSILALAAKRAGGVDKTKVIYCGTFSKSITPGLRIGWVVAAQEIIHKLVLIMQGSNLHVSFLNQMIAHEIASTTLEKHTAVVRKVYKERRDAMIAAFEKYMPPGVTWIKPEGGMFVWLTFPPSIDTRKLVQRAVEEIKVAFVPGSAFYPDHSGHNTARFNFSLSEPAVIEEGIKRLGKLLRETL